MSRRIPVLVLMGLLAFCGACTNKKVSNPLANVGSKQPDKVLFDRAMDALKHNRFDVARLTLQTLINTYPDSEFVARAKLGVADSWYAEGGSTALAQAEIEYNDFKTFFPNMPEAAEAQLKIANIHYQQMEKPDRDYTHALRAEQEYRNLMMQFPDSKLIPTAKQRLLEVQEVLAEREFQVGRFYFLKESYPAAIARLRSAAEQYPLYSKADEVLYMLGQTYEGEMTLTRNRPTCVTGQPAVACVPEAMKARLLDQLTKEAAQVYSKILTRYPVMNRSDDAKLRLIDLHQPVPRPTKAALAQNKAEEDSRRETTAMTKVLRNFSKHPDVAQAARVGDPTLVDPEPVSATSVMRETNGIMTGHGSGSEKSSVGVETVGNGAPPAESQPVPRSGDAAHDGSAAATATVAADPASPAATDAAAPAAEAPPAQPDANELTPNVPADPNELKPNTAQEGGQVLPAPPQVNEIQPSAAQSGSADQAPAAAGKATDSSADQLADDAAISSSKHKKKKGLKKVVPF
jgi:outer membrane protein assembly factor BamD